MGEIEIVFLGTWVMIALFFTGRHLRGRAANP